MRLQVLVVVLLMMTGCPGPKLPCADGACGTDAGATVDAGSEGVDAGGPVADAGATVDAGLPAFESEAECAHLRGGPSAPATAVQLVCGSACVVLGGACAVGIGVCRNAGTAVCSNGTVTCSATPNPPTTEVCNQLDDDCDGAADEATGSEPPLGVCRPAAGRSRD